jgi:hypothetical protein
MRAAAGAITLAVAFTVVASCGGGEQSSSQRASRDARPNAVEYSQPLPPSTQLTDSPPVALPPELEYDYEASLNEAAQEYEDTYGRMEQECFGDGNWIDYRAWLRGRGLLESNCPFGHSDP